MTEGSVIEHKTLREQGLTEVPGQTEKPYASGTGSQASSASGEAPAGAEARAEAADRSGAEASHAGYLLAPVRGMTALIILLSMLAAAMYCREDREDGRLAALPGRGRGPVILAYLLPAGVLSSAAALMALYAAGIAGALPGELLSMICFLLLSMVFCAVLYLVLPTAGAIAAALPFVILLVLLQCPVFLDIPSLQPLRVLLPPYYYIQLCSGIIVILG